MRSRLVALLCVIAAAPRVAHAFADSAQFFDNAMTPHGASLSPVGEGIYFTGAPRWTGLSCASCHANGPQALGIQISADPAGLFTDGYTPGQTYAVEVVLTGETQGLDDGGATCTVPPGPTQHYTYAPCNNNNFGLEIDAAYGPLQGASTYCAAQPDNGACPMPMPLTDPTIVAPMGDAIFGNRVHDANNPTTLDNDPTRWTFWFTAPPAGTGPLTLYATAVDGNGGDGTADNDQDVFGDDTVSAMVPIHEANGGGPLDAIAGCDVARGRPRGGALGVVLVLFGILARRRRTIRVLQS